MTSESRRRFLGGVVAWASAAFGALLAVPAVSYLIHPLRQGASARTGLTRVASLSALPEGVPVKVTITRVVRDAWMVSPPRPIGAVWLLRRGESVRAWSVICPHLGCAVDYRRAEARFACPCHESAFDAEGRRLSGPSPRDLDPLEVDVQGGVVRVGYVRFRKGIASREVVG